MTSGSEVKWRTDKFMTCDGVRDYATINQLICLSNMENLNAVFINEGIPQRDRLHKLNKIAIQHMKNIQWMLDSDLRERRTKEVLEEVGNRKLLK